MDHLVHVGQPFDWNPSLAGAKAEETLVLTETGAKVVARAPAGAMA
ncbi:MAG TPA: hypothetical protein VHF45_08220 [Thermoleophilaceae bacterium]|jgi:hypothetical protein|nr:hypothetical protein [Thermoleophilaceae bacterium]